MATRENRWSDPGNVPESTGRTMGGFVLGPRVGTRIKA